MKTSDKNIALLDEKGNFLSDVTRAKARKLLDKKAAKVKSYSPFIIQRVNLNTQEKAINALSTPLFE